MAELEPSCGVYIYSVINVAEAQGKLGCLFKHKETTVHSTPGHGFTKKTSVFLLKSFRKGFVKTKCERT